VTGPAAGHLTVPLRLTAGTHAGPCAGQRTVWPAIPAQAGLSRDQKLKARTRAGNGDLNRAACEGCGTFLGPLAGEVRARVLPGPDGTVPGGLAAAVLLCGSVAGGTGCAAAAARRDPRMTGFQLVAGTDPARVPVVFRAAAGYTTPVWLSASRPAYLSRPPEGAAA
jgi:hypothetical protein